MFILSVIISSAFTFPFIIVSEKTLVIFSILVSDVSVTWDWITVSFFFIIIFILSFYADVFIILLLKLVVYVLCEWIGFVLSNESGIVVNFIFVSSAFLKLC